MTNVYVFLAVFLSGMSFVHGFADWFTKDYCSRKLFVGQVIMNNKAVASDERYVRVFRGTNELKSGDVYQPSESLTISISDTKPQYVYEVSEGGAKFEKGGCEGRRIADKPKVTLVMPAKGTATTSEFEIIIGWAIGHEEVRISPAFRLVSAESMGHHDAPKVVANDVKSKSKLNKLSGMSRKKLDEEKGEDQVAVDALFENGSKGKGEKEQIVIEEEGEYEHETILEADHHAAVKEQQEEEDHRRHLPHDSQDHHIPDSLLHEGLKHHASSEQDELDHAPKHAPEVEQQHHEQEQHEEHKAADHREHDHPGNVDAEEMPPPVLPKKAIPAASSHEMQELEELHSLADHIHHLDEQHNQGGGHVEDGHQEDNSHHRSNHVDHAEGGQGLEPEPLSSIFHRERAEDVHDHDKHADNTHDHKEGMPLHGRPSELHENHNHEHEQHHDTHEHEHEHHDNNHHDTDHHDLKIQHERENDFQGFHEKDHHQQQHHHEGDVDHPIHDPHHEHEHESVHDSNHHEHDHAENHNNHEHEHASIHDHNNHEHEHTEDRNHEHEHTEDRNRDNHHPPGATGGEGAFPDPHLNFGLGLGLGGVHPPPFGHVQEQFNRLHDQLQGDHMIQPPPPHHQLMGQMHAEAVRQHVEQGLHEDPHHPHHPANHEQLMVIPSEEEGQEEGREGHNKEHSGEAEEGKDIDSSHAEHHNTHHKTTDQFHHKFGVPGKEEEFHEQHHKYKIVNSNINKDKNPLAAADKGKDDHASGSTTKRVISALGAKAAATMKTMTKLRGGPQHASSHRGHGLGYVSLWEWLGLAAAALLIFGVSRVVANRHKLKRYVLRRQGYDLDK